jgi:hypothetical protein
MKIDALLARKWTPFLIIAVATALVWGRSISFDFVWDDQQFIVENKSIRSLRNIPEMFYRIEAQASMPYDFRVFRPLRTAQYALLHFLGGKAEPQPWIFHLANIIWHAAAAMLLFSAASRLFQMWGQNLSEEASRRWALLVALGFAVHPVVSEVVCWAKSLDDIMAAVFTLAALRELLKPNGWAKNLAWSLFYFLLAVYSKESAVPFAVIPFFVLRHSKKWPWQKCFVATSGFLAMAAVYMAHRHFVIGRSSQTEPISGTYAQTLIDMFPVAPEYLRLLCGVPPFFIDYSFMKGHFALVSMAVLLGVALLIGLLVFGIWSWRNEKFRLAGLGLLWTGLFLLPVSNLLPMMQYMAERFLYLPLIGWLLAIAALLSAWRKETLATALGTALVLVWMPLAWSRSEIWRDPVTLFVRSSREGPKTLRVEQNAIASILRLPHVRNVFHLEPKNGKLQVVGRASPSETESVIATLEEAHRLFPDSDTLAAALGISYATANQPRKAAEFFEEAARLKPSTLDHWQNLAQANIDLKNYVRAEEALAQAEQLKFDHPRTVRLRATLFWQKEEYAKALQTFELLDQLEPNSDAKHWMEEARKKLSH